jgi:hypothetical protein
MLIAWIMFIHVQIFLLSDFITSGNIELLFRFAQRSIYEEEQPVRFSAFRPVGGIEIQYALVR